jgi:hypothetical protein
MQPRATYMVFVKNQVYAFFKSCQRRAQLVVALGSDIFALDLAGSFKKAGSLRLHGDLVEQSVSVHIDDTNQVDFCIGL